MTDFDYVLAQARRLYQHYHKLTPPNKHYSSVAEDFGSIVENLEYIQHRLHGISSKT